MQGVTPAAADERLSRRGFIAAGAALAGAAALPASAAAGVARPRGFPRGVDVARRRFVNWAQEIEIDGVWTCTPHTPGEVVGVVNWAWQHGYRVRALGRAHNWSPLALASTPSRSPRVVLVDTTRHLTAMRLAGGGPPAVVTQTGTTMDDLLAFLQHADSGADRASGAGGPHGGRRAGDRRPRHGDPRTR